MGTEGGTGGASGRSILWPYWTGRNTREEADVLVRIRVHLARVYLECDLRRHGAGPQGDDERNDAESVQRKQEPARNWYRAIHRRTRSVGSVVRHLCSLLNGSYLVAMAIDRRASRDILLYGLFAGALIVLFKLVEYRWLVRQHSAPMYGGIVAAVFAVIGIRLGQKLTRTRTVERVVLQEIRVPADGPFVKNDDAVARSGITPRELEILGLIADGLSNREIAARLFVSENTVKTHSSRLLDKLNAKRRTQAVQIAKDRGLIP